MNGRLWCGHKPAVSAGFILETKLFRLKHDWPSQSSQQGILMRGLVGTDGVESAVIFWDTVCFTLTLSWREINNQLGLSVFCGEDTLHLPLTSW